jgi:hypothetical protein
MLQQALRSLLPATALLFPLMTLNSGVALADQRDFKLINDSRVVINEVYVSTVTTNDWEEDVLGRDTLGSGEMTMITFSRGAAGTCAYDIRVVTAQNQAVERANVNLCETNDVIFTGSALRTR